MELHYSFKSVLLSFFSSSSSFQAKLEMPKAVDDVATISGKIVVDEEKAIVYEGFKDTDMGSSYEM